MIKYLKNFGRMLYQGFYSIAEGMSTFNVFPTTEIELSSQKENWEEINRDIAGYWKSTGKYLENAIKKTSEELNSKL